MPAKTKLNELLDGYGQEIEVEESPISQETPVEEQKVDDKVPPSRRGKRHIRIFRAGGLETGKDYLC